MNGDMRPPEPEFGRGIRHFGLMITRVIMALVLLVLLAEASPPGAADCERSQFGTTPCAQLGSFTQNASGMISVGTPVDLLREAERC